MITPRSGEDSDGGQEAFFPRPRGVGPKNKAQPPELTLTLTQTLSLPLILPLTPTPTPNQDWDTSIGEWVPKGQSKGKQWIATRTIAKPSKEAYQSAGAPSPAAAPTCKTASRPGSPWLRLGVGVRVRVRGRVG